MRYLLLLAVLLVGCPPPVPVPPPGPLTDDSCVDAETRLLALDCRDSRNRALGGPNLHGTKFSAICRENMANGVDMQPRCLATIPSCKELSTCHL